jgi:hypothetical protein
MSVFRGVGLLPLLLLSASGVQAQHKDPFYGANRFPQFRNLSGLAGGGFGTDARGYTLLGGATAYSTPTAYVLGHNQWELGLARTSFTDGPAVFTNADGTGIAMYGTTWGRFNIAVTDMVLSAQFDQAFHLQAQYISSPTSRWTASLGMQDVGGGGGSSGDGAPDDNRTSRSAFGVTTFRGHLGSQPASLSFGIGTRRFRTGFLSGSVQLARPLRFWAEEDGFGVNFGFLLTLRANDRPHATNVSFLLGMLRNRYFTASATLGF